MYVSVLLASLAALLGGAQDAPQPRFKSGVHVVEVDVRVFDKEGRFTADLTQDDFDLVENGTVQRIQAMYLVGAAAAPPTGTGEAPAAAAPVAGTPAAAPAAPQAWIFLFDLNHLTPGSGFDRARTAVETFIRDRFKEGDIGGILAGDKMVGNRLTSVRAELLEAVKQVKPRSDSRSQVMELTREWPRFLDEEEAIRVHRNEREWVARAVQRACSDDPEQCNAADAAVRGKAAKLSGEIQRSSLATLSALNVLANGLAKIPGPKTIVLLSDGFVAQEVEGPLRSVVGQVARAGARVYAIDVRGLSRVGGSGLIDQPRVEDPAGPSTRFDTVADAPNSVAVDTGGLMIRNENNIGRALDRVADDAGQYYVLAYQPANTNFDGKYRPIEVRVKRDGVRVRARRGYLALPPARMTIPQPIKTHTGNRDAVATVATPPDSASAAVTPASAPTPSPLEPVAALPPPATGKIVADAAPGVPAAAGGAIRLRPDTGSRVRALSSRDAGASSDLAQVGWKAYERGDVEAAEKALSRAAAQPDARPWVHYALGMSQAALGRARDAIASWERVRQAAPDFEPVYMDLADTYAQVMDLTKALAVVRDAEKRWPGNADIQSAIGVIHVRRGALDDGIEALEKAARLSTEDGLVHLNLGRAYALRFQRGRRYVTSQRRWVAPEGDRARAIEAFKRCVQIGGAYARAASEELTLLEWSK
jgi:VWFA-related protein